MFADTSKRRQTMFLPANVDILDAVDSEGNITQPSVPDDDTVILPKELSTEDAIVEDGASAWKPRLILRSHLDTVNSVAFHPTKLLLASGSEDGMVKLWNLSGLSPTPQKTHLSWCDV
jgi:WD40 repeat protein